MTRRVVLLVLDGLPLERVTARTMPTLSGLHPVAATGVMCSATYPNHATFVTGASPLEHGLTANWVVREGTFQPAQDVGPAVDTAFDVAARAGIASAAVFGDHHLVGVTGARRADHHWPPDGVVPTGVEVDGSGYATDAETLPRLLEVLAGPARLVVAQLNGGDTVGHESGPSSFEATAAYSEYDRCLGAVLEATEPDDVVCVVSDHAQVPGVEEPAVDLWSPLAAAGLDLRVVPEGDAAVVVGPDPTAGAWLDEVPGVVGHVAHGPDRLVWARPGHLVGHGDAWMAGVHGGPATLVQVAAVSGHDRLRERVAAGISSADWAPTMLGLLGLPASGMSGSDLLG